MSDAKRLFVIAGPSGVGKSYLIERLVTLHPNEVIAPKLYTTRQPRPGERAVDREFVSQETFETMYRSGKFRFAEEYSSNWYEYLPDAIEPTDKHNLINVTPTMVSWFTDIPSVVMIGLSVDLDKLSLLERRMRTRGDTPEIIKKRIDRVLIDQDNVINNQELIESSGRIFTIFDDTSITSVIQWFEDTYLIGGS